MLNDTFRTVLTINAEKRNEPEVIVAFVNTERTNNTNNFLTTVLDHYFQADAPKPLSAILIGTLIELKEVFQQPYEAFIASYPHKEALEKAIQSGKKRPGNTDSDEPSTSLFKKKTPPAPSRTRLHIERPWG